MSTVTGVVEAINKKSGYRKSKKWEMFSYAIDDKWYGGFKDEKNADTLAVDEIVEGDTIEMETEVNGKYTNWTSIKLLKSSPRVKDSGGVTVSSKDFRSCLGGALKCAVPLAQSMKELGMVAFGGNEEQQQILYTEFVYDLAEQLANKMWNATPGDTDVSNSGTESGDSVTE